MAHTYPTDKTHVIIARHWHKPEITSAIRYTDLGARISIEMDLEDFIRAVVHELANDRWALRTTTFESRVLAASETVLERMKRDHSAAVLTL